MPMIQRFFQPPERSFFLFGPRGTGKSTWMRKNYPDALYLDLLTPSVLQSYLAKPGRLAELLEDHPEKKQVIIDEVQKAPSLLSVVHQEIEKKKNKQFILTGSSPRKLKRTSGDLLGGRALKRQLHPFMAAELGESFILENALTQGLLPLVAGQQDAADILHGYISFYVQEEVQAEGLVRNVENFSRFLEAISFSHGGLLNITNIASECSIKRKTVENYIGILEELLLAYQIPVFSKRAQRAVSAHPKLYLFDSGVFHTLRPHGPLDRPEEIRGASLEGLVAAHLRAWSDYSIKKHSISFWRTRSGVEVDFVVYGPQGFWALEVKNSQHISQTDTKGLNTFLTDYPEAQAILLYCGQETFRRGKVLCLPCDVFLRQLRPDQLLLGVGRPAGYEEG